MLRTGYRSVRRLLILMVGSTITLLGVALLVLPGPAVLVIPVGLAILGVEFAWARRWLRKFRDQADTMIRNGTRRRSSDR